MCLRDRGERERQRMIEREKGINDREEEREIKAEYDRGKERERESKADYDREKERESKADDREKERERVRQMTEKERERVRQRMTHTERMKDRR